MLRPRSRRVHRLVLIFIGCVLLIVESTLFPRAAAAGAATAPVPRPPLRMDSYAYPQWKDLPGHRNAQLKVQACLRVQRAAEHQDCLSLTDKVPDLTTRASLEREVTRFYAAARTCLERIPWTVEMTESAFNAKMQGAASCLKAAK